MENTCFGIVLGLVLLSFSVNVQAQKYGTAIGLRLGNPTIGISLVQRLQQNPSTIEAMLALNKNQWQINTLYRHHRPIIGKSLNAYLGGGVHLGHVQHTDSLNNAISGMFYGIDPIVGIEMKMLALPINLSAHFKPSIHLIGKHPNTIQWQWGVSARYIIVTERDIKRKQRKKKISKHREDIKNKLDGLFK